MYAGARGAIIFGLRFFLHTFLYTNNPEVAGSSPALVNFSLFIQIYNNYFVTLQKHLHNRELLLYREALILK